MPKNDSQRKHDRNKELCEYAEIARKLNHSWREIGKHFGIDGSRAFRIYQKYGKKEVKP